MIHERNQHTFLKTFLLFFFSIVFIKGLITIFITPPFMNPDEPTHLEYSLMWRDRITGNHDSLNSSNYQDTILGSMARYRFWSNLDYAVPDPKPSSFSESPFLSARPTQQNNPPLYYQITGLLLSLFPYETDPVNYLLAGRFFSLIISLFTLAVITGLCRIYTDTEQVWVSGILVFVAFHPGYSIVATTMSPDTLLLLFFVLFFYCLCNLLSISGNYVFWLGLAASFILGILTKRTILFCGPLVFWPLTAIFLKEKKKLTFISYVISCLSLFFMGFLTFIWYFPEELMKLSSILDHLSNIAFYLKFGTPFQGSWWYEFSSTLVKSFWGSAGWMTYFLTSNEYSFFCFFTIFALLALIIFRYMFNESYQISGPDTLWILCFSIIALNLVMVYFFGWTEGMAQGRYLYPSIFPLAILVISGLLSVSSRRYVWWISPLFIVVYVVYSTVSVFRLLLHSYYI